MPKLSTILREKHLPALDGLRAVAVLLVIMGHAGWPMTGIPGDVGVNLFFVLSGFLITRILLTEFDRTGDVSCANFYLRRTFRIFPAYYAFLAATFAVDYVMGDRWPTDMALSAVTYTINYYNAVHGHPPTGIAHAWSLAVEEQFYLLWPLLFIFLASWGRWALKAGIGVLIGTVVGSRSLLLLAGADVAYLYNAFDTRFDSLAIGCGLAVLAGGMDGFASKISRHAAYPIVTVGLICASRLLTPDSYHYSVGFTAEALLAAILMVQLMQLVASGSWRWLESRPVRYLGTLSYPMYLYHALGGAFGRRVPGASHTLEFVGALAATIGLAMGSYYVIERPFLRLRERIGKRVPAVPPSPACDAAAP